MYQVFLRGYPWCRRDTEAEAAAVVNSYDGEGDCWYEKIEPETADEDN